MIDWHYPRKELACKYLDAFATGITAAMCIFAPRRMGKTQFVTRDLATEAEKRGYRVGYCSFWNLQDNPAKALQVALTDIENNSWRKKLNDYISHSASEISASVAGASFSVKTDSPKVEEDDLIGIINSIKRLAKGKKKVLLICDEVQHLADERFSSLIATLRTQFDEHKDSIYVVYTGSSRDGLVRIFRDRRAPMFHMAQQVDFPNLDSSFVNHMLEAFSKATTRSLNLSSGIGIFKDLGHNPSLFHHLLRHMVIAGIWDIEEGYKHFHQLVDVEADYSATFNRCKAIDQAVLKFIAYGTDENLYSTENREKLAQDMGVDSVSTTSVQRSLDRLRADQLVFNIERGKWVLEDESFGTWIIKQAKTVSE